ncbi:MAG: phosphotransferase, partial [Sandaracinaceae bacterium]|nr:phosphotransferase [Sandaracinaceae bacterium]
MEGPPEIVLAEYGLEGASLARISVGWINRTYLVEHPRGRFVLQKLHPVFAPTVHLDIDRITRHLAHEGLETPLLVPTARGDLWVDADGTWRLLSFVEGEIHDRFDAGRAYASAMLVARFHRALAGLEHTFAFTRPGAHDTA